MEHSATEPERDLERTGDELEERLERLDDHIDESKKEAQARAEQDRDPLEDTAGDWEDTDDDGRVRGAWLAGPQAEHFSLARDASLDLASQMEAALAR